MENEAKKNNKAALKTTDGSDITRHKARTLIALQQNICASIGAKSAIIFFVKIDYYEL